MVQYNQERNKFTEISHSELWIKSADRKSYRKNIRKKRRNVKRERKQTSDSEAKLLCSSSRNFNHFQFNAETLIRTKRKGKII
jgi:hypothetical protein